LAISWAKLEERGDAVELGHELAGLADCRHVERDDEAVRRLCRDRAFAAVDHVHFRQA
jgi:hypothetical protein